MFFKRKRLKIILTPYIMHKMKGRRAGNKECFISFSAPNVSFEEWIRQHTRWYTNEHFSKRIDFCVHWRLTYLNIVSKETRKQVKSFRLLGSPERTVPMSTFSLRAPLKRVLNFGLHSFVLILSLIITFSSKFFYYWVKQIH